MFSSHRTAFDNKNQNDALEHNLDKVVNLTYMKLKELMNKKQDKIRENNLMKGQKTVIESDIAFYEKEIKDKEEGLMKVGADLNLIESEIQELETEYQSSVIDFNEKGEDYKHTVNSVSEDLDSIVVASGVEEMNKKSESKLEYESYVKIKAENKNLMETMSDLRRQLYYLEVLYFFNYNCR
jgi:hypothetical protein